VNIAAGPVILQGDLVVPNRAIGTVLFAHGSGSSSQSPRNRFVASELNRVGIATLLIDLLGRDEELDERSSLRFDIEFLARRLDRAAEWLESQPEIGASRHGLFGASTGAAAALVEAARHPNRVAAVVSRGGRPDLAGGILPAVQAPTLLIVGGHDVQVLELNRQACEQLHCVKQLKIVPGATHLFEEPNTLEEVARLACDWFRRYLHARVGKN
jgi:pimeloyl-ACP methyl ester carboxylesterase